MEGVRCWRRWERGVVVGTKPEGKDIDGEGMLQIIASAADLINVMNHAK